MAIKKINRDLLFKKKEEAVIINTTNTNEEIGKEQQESTSFKEDEKESVQDIEDVNLEEEIDHQSKGCEYIHETQNYKTDGKHVYLKSSNNLINTKVSKYMNIKEKQHNIDEGTFKALLEYQSLNGMSEVLLNREEYLNSYNLMKFQSKGLDVIKSNTKLVIEYLRECEEKSPIRNIHSKLGFMKYEGKEVYKLHDAVGIDSTYEGAYDIKPKGSRDKFISMIKSHVLGNVELEFALVSGISSILLGYIGEDLGLDSTIIHLVGNSTTGKSTALRLAISSFGYPDVKKNGLYGTYNGTNNALIKKLGGLKGVPYALDEISMSDSNNFTKFIYSLANGADKERLNKDSELMEKQSWLTTILSNGEKSITRASNKNAGVQVRVIEAENFTWTKNAEHAEAINHTVLNNYGHLGIEFARYLLDQNKRKLIEKHKYERFKLYNELKENTVTDEMSMRRCSKFAILIQTARMLEDMLDIEIDIEGMVGMIINIEQESLKNRNFKKSVIDFIKGYVDMYRNQFDGKTDAKTSEVLGKINEREDYIEVQIEKLSFIRMIKEGGYEDDKVVLKELKKGGFLDCDSDRSTRTRQNSSGVKVEFVVIKLDKYLDQE